MRPGLRTAIICALLFGGTLLLFGRALEFGFVNLDDPGYVTENPMVQRGLSWAGAAWAFTAPSDYWHPLAWLSHMLDCQLYGLSPAGHHLTSVLWHALNAVLVFLLFRTLLGGWWRSAFAAALFAWHPLRVESVVWVAERKDVMSGCFFLLTILAYVRFAAARSAGRPGRWAYGLALVCFAAGLMSKPMVVTVPFVLLLLDYWPLAHRPARLRFLEKLPFFALAGAAAVATVLMQRSAGAFVLRLSVMARLGNAVVSLGRYLGKFIWPFDLVVCYPHPGSWPAAAMAAAVALLLGLVAVAGWQRRGRPWVATGLAWYLITLLPVIGLVQVGFQAMADRYTYLPLLGLELALVPCLPAAATRRWRVAGAGAAVVILAACALRTWDQEAVWRNSAALFEHALQVDPRNDVAEDFLASAFFAAGRFDEAAIHAERARALNPHNDRVLVTLAGVDEHQGRVDEAMTLYRSALTLRPDNPQVECQLGLLELSRGHADRARALMTPALRSAPPLRRRTLQLGRAALDRGDTAAALFLYDLVLAAAPDEAETKAVDDPVLLNRAADRHARLGEFEAAIRVYRRSLALAPSDSGAHAALGYLLIHAGDRSGGLAQWRRALELEPDFPGLREQLRRMGE